MPLSWNEIRDRAVRFSKDWAKATSEQAERQTFWNEFFDVFGIKRKTVACFEEPVRKLSGQWGFIDLFWKGVLLVEHKSAGKPLDKATSQANDYIQGLVSTGRQEETPRYVIISDFQRIALHDYEEGTSIAFPLADLHKHINAFGFIPGYKQTKLGAVEDPINVRAVEMMGELHDALEMGGYAGHDLERFLVRILFCLFAEDTSIFDRNGFTQLIENHTVEDGSDLGPLLARLFQVLNTPEDKRQKNLLEDLAAFPYVNGRLFEENLGFADLNRSMRSQLLRCCNLDWSRISPAVFGSLFQSVMEPKERRQVGAHYTSERDILKLINSLFLDELKEEFEKIKHDVRKLKAFHEKLGKLRFLDPACGCGNFLVVTYRELRLLEIEVLKLVLKNQQVTDVGLFSLVDVDAMYGIEINEFPSLIAEVALWLMDHQMNLKLSEEFGQYFIRLPLTKSAKIVNANALRIDWADVIKPEECSYVLGNPPFVGAKIMDESQREEMTRISSNVKNAGVLDYVTAWYLKAIDYIKNTDTAVAFVSTNSINQGEQVGVLWGEMYRRGAVISFAHRTFIWQSEAKGKAHVHVVIVGFSRNVKRPKSIYDYDSKGNTVNKVNASNISPYLVEGPDVIITNRENPISESPGIGIGNKPIDGGNLLFSTDERDAFIKLEPKAQAYFRKWIGADEFINGWNRWCLWLGDCAPNELKTMPECLKRIDAVKQFRLDSKSAPTRAIASKPTRFHVENFPTRSYLVIPRHSSERRPYIPIGLETTTTITGDACLIISDPSLFVFATLSSTMHMAWMRLVAGRLESRYRYSAKLVYNNYPWPQNPTEKQKANVEAKAQAVLDARAKYPDSSLADLYDPLTMPPDLVKAHEQLDKAVEQCYRSKPFESDRERVEYLFQLYEQLTAPLTAQADKPKRTRKKKTDDGE
jgi:type I restriction-modification system DNA methylase subunit